MFEYLMPSLWMRSYPHTLISQTVCACIEVQKAFARSLGIPWNLRHSFLDRHYVRVPDAVVVDAQLSPYFDLADSLCLHRSAEGLRTLAWNSMGHLRIRRCAQRRCGTLPLSRLWCTSARHFL